MLAWTVGVSLVFMLLLIWSALYRDSLRAKSAQGSRSSAQPDDAEAGDRETESNAAQQAAGK